MTALERAATTFAACLVDAPVAPTFSMADVNGWTEEKAYEIVRAVLMAIRELPDEILNEHLYDSEYGYAMYYEGWQPAIDAILNEKDTTND